MKIVDRLWQTKHVFFSCRWSKNSHSPCLGCFEVMKSTRYAFLFSIYAPCIPYIYIYIYLFISYISPQGPIDFPSPRPLYLNSQLLSLLFDAQASELSSRMSAMKAATDNAKECRGTDFPGPGGRGTLGWGHPRGGAGELGELVGFKVILNDSKWSKWF